MLAGFIGNRLISWLLGPAGKVILLVLAFVAWTVYQRHDATRDCEDAQLRADLIETQRQLAIAEGIAKKARERADQTQIEIDELEAAYADLEANISPGDGCSISPELRERLLRIK